MTASAAGRWRMIGGRVPDRGWKRPFDDPIPLLGGRELVTLEDAGNYITKLPKAPSTRRQSDKQRRKP
jgi:hypothetical protein